MIGSPQGPGGGFRRAAPLCLLKWDNAICISKIARKITGMVKRTAIFLGSSDVGVGTGIKATFVFILVLYENGPTLWDTWLLPWSWQVANFLCSHKFCIHGRF